MAWYVDQSYLVKSDGSKDWWKHWYGPGDEVPVSGIYQCMGCKREITSNNPDRFPPQNHHQHNQSQGEIRWHLIVRTNTTGAA
jgi:hypothetical protein